MGEDLPLFTSAVTGNLLSGMGTVEDVIPDLDRLLARAPVAVYVAEPGLDRPCLYVSEHIVEISGYPASSWTSSAALWRDVIHPDDRSGRLSDEAFWAGCEPDGRVVSSEYRLLRRSGGTVWVRDVARLTTLDDQPVWVGTLQDISESRGVLTAAADGEAHFRSLAEWCPDALIQLDVHGRIAYASPATIAVTPGFFGFHSGQSWLGLVHPEDRERARAFSRDVVAGRESERLRFRSAAAGGDAEWLEATARMMHSDAGAPSGIALSIRRVR